MSGRMDGGVNGRVGGRLIDLTDHARDSRDDRTPLPHVTVVVPTLMARDEPLLRCLRALLDQTYPFIDVLLVDNRSPAVTARPDAGSPPLPRDPRLAVLHQPTPGAAAARCLGLAHATGELVAFTDDDVVVDRDWVLATVRRFLDEPALDCVTGLVDGPGVEDGQPLTYRLTAPWGQRRAFVSALDAEGQVVRRSGLLDLARRWSDNPAGVGPGVNMTWRTPVLRALGGFDVRLGPGTPALAGEDLAAFVRLLWSGGRIGYEPGALVLRPVAAPDGPDQAMRRRRARVGLAAMVTALALTDARLGLALLPQVLTQAPRAMLAGPLAYLRPTGTRRP